MGRTNEQSRRAATSFERLYVPSPEAIAESCREIQRSWSDSERFKRAAATMRPVPFHFPVYEIRESASELVAFDRE
jgi:hypothetical protein